jgi:hypothetical protein
MALRGGGLGVVEFLLQAFDTIAASFLGGLGAGGDVHRGAGTLMSGLAGFDSLRKRWRKSRSLSRGSLSGAGFKFGCKIWLLNNA